MLRLILKKGELTQLRFLCTKTSKQSAMNSNVPGLSDKCVKVPNAPVGPGAAKDKEYKNPEYFCYHVDSFGEAEVELEKHRLPAPSNKLSDKTKETKESKKQKLEEVKGTQAEDGVCNAQTSSEIQIW